MHQELGEKTIERLHTNENVHNYTDRILASLNFQLIRKTVSHTIHALRLHKNHMPTSKDPQHVPLYIPIFCNEAAIELPNDEKCINFGVEWLGGTAEARACSEKGIAREKRDVAFERERSAEREVEKWPWLWRARSAGQPSMRSKDHSGTGQTRSPGFQETVGPDPSWTSPTRYRGPRVLLSFV